MDEYNGVCVGGPADGKIMSANFRRLTYAVQKEQPLTYFAPNDPIAPRLALEFEHFTYLWDETSKTWEYKP
jgi:hypothetical protein